MTAEEIGRGQATIGPLPVNPVTRRDFRVLARWWELESMRDYPSSGKCLEYASNMRWLVELMDNGVNVFRPFHIIKREQRHREAT